MEGFGAIAKPLEERLGQLQTELPKLEAEVDFMRLNKLSADDVMYEANTMYDQWPTLASEDKRKVMEVLVEKVTIGNGEIDITFSCVPSSKDVCKNQQRLRAG